MLRSAQVRAEFAELGFVQLRAGFAGNTVLRAGSWAKCLGPRRVCRESRAL